MNTILLNQLNPEQRNFLLNLLATFPVNGEIIPVYLKDGNNALLIEDFALPFAANKQFEKTAPDGLYRGGGLVTVKTPQGYLVIPDDRNTWWRFIGGIAKINEGKDLRKTALREATEELFLSNLGKTIRFVPPGFGHGASLYSPSLDFEVASIVEAGEVEVLFENFNETNRSYEKVVCWDISSLDEKLLCATNEDWYSGGNSAIVVFVIDKAGQLVGFYSGQQGYFAFSEMKQHESLAKFLTL